MLLPLALFEIHDVEKATNVNDKPSNNFFFIWFLIFYVYLIPIL
ncbi:Hypothetical protein MCYN_0575 [Mycoplasmopsis cynos C142]|uniref:Uncharacterized protein n=1 Tax=Mycoplasmopsis cynos (strain C142) TaxID=1246955 RepID=L0RVY4_MYCC1|nr:Hypothetical protein MCYN_0575 [Mycoplasmopsis cynos C142]